MRSCWRSGLLLAALALPETGGARLRPRRAGLYLNTKDNVLAARKIGADRLPALRVTNPILLWLFAHGWEDPDWGQSPIGQVAISAALQELAKSVADRNVSSQIQKLAVQHAAKVAQGMGG